MDPRPIPAVGTGNRETSNTGTCACPQWLRMLGIVLLGAALAAPIVWLYLSRRRTASRPAAATRRRAATPSEPIQIPVRPLEAREGGEAVSVEPDAGTPSGTGAPAPAPEAAVQAAAALPEQPTLWASTERGVFHYPECRWAKQIKAENKVVLHSREEAVARGYKPCGTCAP